MYASMAIKPLDVYNFMYKNGVCTRQAGLYDAWAWHLETSNNFKTAESVFLKVQTRKIVLTNVRVVYFAEYPDPPRE